MHKHARVPDSDFIEIYARNFGSRTGIEVVGSYDPRPFGLTSRDFNDDNHVGQAGLSSLRWLSGNPWNAKHRGDALSRMTNNDGAPVVQRCAG